MATTNNNQNQADEHHMNAGKTVLQVEKIVTIFDGVECKRRFVVESV